MSELQAGDLVRSSGAGVDMIVIGCADEPYAARSGPATYFCVWEHEHMLHEEVFCADQLMLVRSERRRVPRSGVLDFPKRVSG